MIDATAEMRKVGKMRGNDPETIWEVAKELHVIGIFAKRISKERT